MQRGFASLAAPDADREFAVARITTSHTALAAAGLLIVRGMVATAARPTMLRQLAG